MPNNPWNGLLLQSANAHQGNSTADLSVAFAGNTLVNSLLIATFSWYNAANPSRTISDTQLNTWNHFGQQNADASSGIDVYWALATAGGANAVKFNSATSLYKDGCVFEFPGLTNTALDAGAGGAGTATLINFGSITPANTQELVFAAGYAINGAINSIGQGWTVGVASNSNATDIELANEYQINGTTNAVSPSFNSSGSYPSASIVLAFKNMGTLISGGGGGSIIGSNIVVPWKGQSA